MDVVDVAQPKQAGEQAAGEHPGRQVQADGQALADDAAAPTNRDDTALAEVTRALKHPVLGGFYLRYIPTA